MKTQIRLPRLVVLALLATILCAPAMAQPDHAIKKDFGKFVEHLLHSHSLSLFGVIKPLIKPADSSDYVAREKATAMQRVKLAKGLKAKYVARNVASLGDMITFWPNDKKYTHLIICIEQGRSGTTPGGNGGQNSAIQRVNVKTGKVETILYGMSRCDGIRTTAWGTILATEETSDGRAYELIDPLNTTGHWVANRATGDIRDSVDGTNASSKIVQRPALPTMSWEGLTVLPSGVVIGGDELRPGSGTADSDGGAIFKFIPSSPRTASGKIADLSQSPLAAGRVYAMQISCRDSFQQFGQGCEIGIGAWVKVNALTARSDANTNGATGYYRPEDLHVDPKYTGIGTRFCWTNTGNEGAKNYGEVICAVDQNPMPANPADVDVNGKTYLHDGANMTKVVANRFIEGDPRFNAHDNLAFNPKTGLIYVIEDHQYGEVYACLRDGADRDIKSDGCVSILSVVDPSAEPTGFIFDGSGKVAFVILQHGENPPELSDTEANKVNGRTDDLLMITGFKIGNRKK